MRHSAFSTTEKYCYAKCRK